MILNWFTIQWLWVLSTCYSLPSHDIAWSLKELHVHRRFGSDRGSCQAAPRLGKSRHMSASLMYPKCTQRKARLFQFFVGLLLLGEFLVPMSFRRRQLFLATAWSIMFDCQVTHFRQSQAFWHCRKQVFGWRSGRCLAPFSLLSQRLCSGCNRTCTHSRILHQCLGKNYV